MANIHTFLHRIYIRTLRFRHRNGYGVHSPFAYNLIKGVIYESHMYYAYPELARMRGSYAGRLSVSGRMDRLMFRLANYVRPEKAAIVGRNRGVTGKYVAAGCRKAQVMQADSPAGMAGKRYDLCYVAPGEDAYGALPPAQGRKAFLWRREYTPRPQHARTGRTYAKTRARW